MKRGGCGDFEWDWRLVCKQWACTCDLLLHPSSRTVCLGWLGAVPLERAHLGVCVQLAWEVCVPSAVSSSF